MDVFIPSLIRPFDPNEHQDLLAIPRCLINDKKYNIDLEPFDISKIMTQGKPLNTVTDLITEANGNGCTVIPQTISIGIPPPPVVCCIQETKDQIDSVMKGLKTCQEDYDRIEKVFINSNNLIEGVKNWKDICLDRIKTINDEIKDVKVDQTNLKYKVGVLDNDINPLATKIHNIECQLENKGLCSQTQKEMDGRIKRLESEVYDADKVFTIKKRVKDLEDDAVIRTNFVLELQKEFNEKINRLKESMSSTQDSFAKALERIEALEKKNQKTDLEIEAVTQRSHNFAAQHINLEKKVNLHLEPRISINEQRTNDIYEKIKEMEKTISYNDTVHSKLILELQKGFDLLRADYKVEMEELKKKVSTHDENIKGLALSTTQPPPCPAHERKMKLYDEFLSIMKGKNSFGWFCPNCEMMAFGSSNTSNSHTCPMTN